MKTLGDKSPAVVPASRAWVQSRRRTAPGAGILILLAGCAAPIAPQTAYTVSLDPGLSVDSKLAVMAAVGSWQAATLNAGSTVAILTVVDGVADIQVRSACLPQHVVGNTVGRSITLDEGQIAAGGLLTQQVAAHELGHAMGLLHLGAGSLMCATTDCQAPGPTDEDVAAWVSR